MHLHPHLRRLRGRGTGAAARRLRQMRCSWLLAASCPRVRVVHCRGCTVVMCACASRDVRAVSVQQTAAHCSGGGAIRVRRSNCQRRCESATPQVHPPATQRTQHNRRAQPREVHAYSDSDDATAGAAAVDIPPHRRRAMNPSPLTPSLLLLLPLLLPPPCSRTLHQQTQPHRLLVDILATST